VCRNLGHLYTKDHEWPAAVHHDPSRSPDLLAGLNGRGKRSVEVMGETNEAASGREDKGMGGKGSGICTHPT